MSPGDKPCITNPGPSASCDDQGGACAACGDGSTDVCTVCNQSDTIYCMNDKSASSGNCKAIDTTCSECSATDVQCTTCEGTNCWVSGSQTCTALTAYAPAGHCGVCSQDSTSPGCSECSPKSLCITSPGTSATCGPTPTCTTCTDGKDTCADGDCKAGYCMSANAGTCIAAANCAAGTKCVTGSSGAEVCGQCDQSGSTKYCLTDAGKGTCTAIDATCSECSATDVQCTTCEGTNCWVSGSQTCTALTAYAPAGHCGVCSQDSTSPGCSECSPKSLCITSPGTSATCGPTPECAACSDGIAKCTSCNQSGITKYCMNDKSLSSGNCKAIDTTCSECSATDVQCTTCEGTNCWVSGDLTCPAVGVTITNCAVCGQNATTAGCSACKGSNCIASPGTSAKCVSQPDCSACSLAADGTCQTCDVSYCWQTGGTCGAASQNLGKHCATCSTSSTPGKDLCTSCDGSYCYIASPSPHCVLASPICKAVASSSTNPCESPAPGSNCDHCDNFGQCTACLDASGNTHYCPTGTYPVSACTEQENCAICASAEDGSCGECAHHPINYCMGTGGTCQATSPIANCGTCSSTDGDVCTACLPATTSPTTQYCPAVIQGLTFACTEQENCAICSDLEDGLCGKCATNYCMGTGGTCQATSPIANCGTCSSTDGDVCTACLPFSGNTMYCPVVSGGLTVACTEQEGCALCDIVVPPFAGNGHCGECAAGCKPMQGDGTCAPCT